MRRGVAGSALVSGMMLAAVAVAASSPARADEFRTYSKAAAFDDIKFELNNAIVDRGLTVDNTGRIGEMLERTGADVGSTKKIYKNAEFLTFCSAKLSRQMMEADPANVGFCPYVVFVYEAEAKPGTTVVGYRRPMSASGSEATKKALGEIDALLDGIVKDAVK
jgi:hypothetical protein